MKAIVTGISGFVAGHLVEHLRASGDECCGLSRSDWDLARDEAPPAEIFDRLTQLAPEAIYHLAGLSIPGECGPQQPTAEAWATNVEGTRRVLELALKLPSRPRVLMASSSHVYGRPQPGAVRLNESAPLQPHNGYGRSKLAAEAQADLALARGVDVVIARAFQHTGPRQTNRMMLPEWASQFAAPEPVRIHSRNIWIDLTDVRDVVRAYRLLMLHGKAGQRFNVGSGICRRTGDIFELLRQIADPARPYVETQPGERRDPIADPERLYACTGWQPLIPLETTIRDTLAWWRPPRP